MKSNKNALQKLFGFLDSLCSGYITIQQARSPENFEGRGVVIPEGQVISALSGQEQILPWPDFEEYYNTLCVELNTDESMFAQLARSMKLCDFEIFVLLLAYAPDQNRKYERVFGYLQDNISEKYATLGLAADLFSLIRLIPDKEIFGLCDEGHILNRFVLTGERVGLSRPLRLRETAMLYLNGAEHLSTPLQHVCALLYADDCPAPIILQEETKRCACFAKNCIDVNTCGTGLLALYGAEGSGKRFYLHYAAKETACNVLCIDCERLLTLEKIERLCCVDEAISYCRLNNSIPALLHFDFKRFSEAEQIGLAQDFLSRFAGALPLIAICGDKPLKLRFDAQFCLYRMELPKTTIAESVIFWQEFSKRCTLPLNEELDCLSLANNYSLTPGQICQVLQSADMACLALGACHISSEEISTAVRLLCSPRLSALTEPLQGHFDWNDLVLDEEALEILHRLCERINYRWKVNEEWGFDRKLPYGKGVSVLLYGPSGTGKTMTAQVLAREFGLDAYRVDLARIIDKYIGETEKKLAELFDAAQDSNAILFFDEADALFSKRTEVSDSKDKYANAETAYLLQRMEQHNGISLLATNNMQNFDKAFKRRITYIVSIDMPDRETRLKLWKAVFPKNAPLDKNLNFELLAEKAELSGSAIKTVALSAAYEAAAKSCSISMDILRRCIVEEIKRNGRVIAEYELM